MAGTGILRAIFQPQPGFFDINGENISYSNVKNMYKTGNGSALQIDCSQDKYEEAHEICDKIADLFYMLGDLLNHEKAQNKQGEED